ncbi:hypothetical protein SAMN03080615_00943 [Amphritea atlantica]|uniref:Uncharacterized protein n=1 Tax=Amphritea atlantica TaxID=355243 RepID=A0A1H9EK63_9GAMM|nr:hypothetical protein SAMN03080615_00943 [Amphritea atlantica]
MNLKFWVVFCVISLVLDVSLFMIKPLDSLYENIIISNFGAWLILSYVSKREMVLVFKVIKYDSNNDGERFIGLVIGVILLFGGLLIPG